MIYDHCAFSGLHDTYSHYIVNHSAGQYAVTWWHTNGVESVWALFNRQIIGTHH